MRNEISMWEAMAEQTAAEQAAREAAMDMQRAFTPERSVARMVGSICGMIRHLKSRPEPESPGTQRREREVMEALRAARARGEVLLGTAAPGAQPGTDRWSTEEGFGELFFVVRQDFFDLLEALDERFPVR